MADSAEGNGSNGANGAGSSEMVNSSQANLMEMELEAELRGPNGKATAARLIARIDQLSSEIEAYKRSGPPPTEYAQVELINKALAAARGIVLGLSRKNRNKDINL